MELDTISDSMYDLFKAQKAGFDYSRQSWYRPLMKLYADTSPNQLLEQAKQVLLDYSEIVGKKQFDLNVGINAWILKPGGKSRGRGIEIHTDLEDLQKSIMVNSDQMWVV